MFTSKYFQPVSFTASLLLAGIMSACGGGADVSDTAVTSSQADTSVKAQRSIKAAGNANYEQAAQSLYVAYFGRPADQAGLTTLEQQLAAAKAPTGVAAIDTSY